MLVVFEDLFEGPDTSPVSPPLMRRLIPTGLTLLGGTLPAGPLARWPHTVFIAGLIDQIPPVLPLQLHLRSLSPSSPFLDGLADSHPSFFPSPPPIQASPTGHRSFSPLPPPGRPFLSFFLPLFRRPHPERLGPADELGLPFSPLLFSRERTTISIHRTRQRRPPSPSSLVPLISPIAASSVDSRNDRFFSSFVSDPIDAVFPRPHIPSARARPPQ